MTDNSFIYLLTYKRKLAVISQIPTSLIFAHFINKQKQHDILSCTKWDYD